MNKIKCVLLLIFISAFLGCKVFNNTDKDNSNSQTKFLNLNFELSLSNGYPWGWFAGGQGFKVAVDSSEFYSGKKSLRISKISAGSFGVATTSFPIEAAKGKHVSYTGYIKTQNIVNGYAGLWWRVDGKNGNVLYLDNMSDRGPSGTTPWRRYKIDLDVSKDAKDIVFGVLSSGDGTAWFDDLNIEIDGKEYKQVAPKTFVPSNKQLSWIKKNAITFDTVLTENEGKNLEKLKQIIGNSRIIALGEGTHGTSEFFKMKDQIVRYTADEYKNVVFAIEANMPEAKRVNDYITTGVGDPKAALSGMYFWTWNTQEVLDMIKWMRRYNISKKEKIKFWGFDCQYPTIAIQNIKDFIKKYDVNYYDSLNIYYNVIPDIFPKLYRMNEQEKISEASNWYRAAITVLSHLKINRSKYLEQDDSTDVDWIIQNARIVSQGAEINIPGKKSRDEDMALNVEWIIDHSAKNAKIVLWAHNGHISKANYCMGNYLNHKYGNEFINLGFAFHSGKYTAYGDTGLGVYTTSNSEPGSVEWALHKTGMKRMILDLRKVSDSPDSKWLEQTLYFREIGAHAMDNGFFPTIITDDFDVLIFFDKTTPSHLLLKSYTHYNNN